MNKVVHVFKNYFPPARGGIEHHIRDVVHGLKHRFDFTVLTTTEGRRRVVEDDDGVKVVRVPVWAWMSSVPIAPAWLWHLRSTDHDLVHFHVPNPTAEALFVLSRARTPCVATYHAEITRLRPLVWPYRPVLRLFLRRADGVIVTSPTMGGSAPALRRLGDRARLIPLGVDPAGWNVRPPRADRLREEAGRPVVLCVGRLVHYKGVEVLVDAMRDVSGVLFVVGQGGRQGELEDRIRMRGLGDRVRLLGEVDRDELVAHYHAADVVVLPSTKRGEGFGTVLLEAMACGKPVISTDLGTGTSWVNVDGVTGFVVPPRDPAALAKATNELLASEQLRTRMGEAGRARVRLHFTKARMLDALAETYGSVIRERGRGAAVGSA
ncbi:MAG: glycosyltransferase [Candidatus Binatia bacterium]